jgi:hypothetical protein
MYDQKDGNDPPWYCQRCTRILEYRVNSQAIKCFVCDKIKGIIILHKDYDIFMHRRCEILIGEIPGYQKH